MTEHSQSKHLRHTVLMLRMALMMVLVSCLAYGTELTAGVNWSAWTHATLSSPEGQRVQSQRSEKEIAQWLASKVTRKMDAVGIVPTTGVLDHIGNWLLNRRSGNCSDVAMIFQDVFEAADIGQPFNIEVRISKDASRASDPFGCNDGHGVLALSIDGVIYVFDPWMDSYNQSLLSRERWSYGNYQHDSKWNAMPVVDWWDSMLEAGYTRFQVGLTEYVERSWHHTNSISGVADIKAACTDHLESKNALRNAWEGTWSIKSKHRGIKSKGASATNPLVVSFDKFNKPTVYFAGIKTTVRSISVTTLIYQVTAGGNKVTTTLHKQINGSIKGSFTGSHIATGKSILGEYNSVK